MKKTYLIILSMFIAGLSFGQNQIEAGSSVGYPLKNETTLKSGQTSTALLQMASIPSCQITAAILGSPISLSWNDDVRAQLMSTGMFSSIDIFYYPAGVPTLAQIQDYDAILAYSDGGSQPFNTSLGNLLAQYIEIGGGVVNGAFLTASIPLGGNFVSSGYELIIPVGQTQGSVMSIGTVFDPSHPIMENVNSFNGGLNSYRGTGTTVTSGSVVIANWTDGRPLVVIKENVGPANARRADLNFYPPSSNARADFWDASTDGDILMANALLWVSQKCGCPDDITVDNDPGQCGAVVVYDTPPGTQTSGYASGSLFPVGTTTNTFTNPDCSFTVTVNDVEDPTITCNAPIAVNNDPGQCGAVVKYLLPEMSDNCSFPPLAISGLTSLGVYAGHTYYISDGLYTGPAAFADAIAKGGFLASINSAAENVFVRNAATSAGGGLVLIGFNDVATEGTFVWQNGEPVTYTNWNGGEPNDLGGEDYTQILGSGKWNDVPGSGYTYKYILELTVGLQQTAGLPSGSTFPVGTTTNTFVLTDNNGNSAECSFDVIVNDAEDPVAICKNITVMLDEDGLAVIDANDVDGGSSDNCNFTLSVEPNAFDCDNVGENTVTLTVTDASGNTAECTATVNIVQRPTTLTYNGQSSAQYSDGLYFSARLTDDLTGNYIEGMKILFEFGTQSLIATTNEFGLAVGGIILTQNPCDMDDWTVKATFAGECPYLSSLDEDDFEYLPEDADMEYTGTAISATKSMSSNNFIVTLRAVIWEDDNDGIPGDISNAMARFVVNGVDVSGWMPVIWLSEGDHTIGMIEYLWESAISANPTTYDVKIELDGCYFAGSSIDYPLTVYNAAGDFITGGGHMIMTDAAAGLYAPTPDSKMNFGFNVKFNKRGTNLQGKMNIIYRVMDGDEVVTVYQIKSNATTSLGTNLKDAGALIAEFVSKADLTDVTDPENPVSLGGNLTLHVLMTDKGEPGVNDMIAFSLYDGTPNALWLSSNWNGTKTNEQLIDGGNLVVHSGVALTPPDDVVVVPKPGKNKSAIISDVTENSFMVYPNPFTDKLRFEFVSPEAVNARIEMYDITGRMIQTVFNSPVESGVTYNAEFIPNNQVGGMYMYHMILGNEVYKGKVVFKK